MEFCQDAQFKLEAIPSSTVEYVESLTFLDTIQEKVSLYFIKKVHCRRPWNFVSYRERPFICTDHYMYNLKLLYSSTNCSVVVMFLVIINLLYSW